MADLDLFHEFIAEWAATGHAPDSPWGNDPELDESDFLVSFTTYGEPMPREVIDQVKRLTGLPWEHVATYSQAAEALMHHLPGAVGESPLLRVQRLEQWQAFLEHNPGSTTDERLAELRRLRELDDQEA